MMTTRSSEIVYIPIPPDTDDPRLRQAIIDYNDAVKRVETGEFPVTKGSKVFRVIAGLKVGSSTPNLSIGENVTNNYATPSVEAVKNIIAANDIDQQNYDGSPFDSYQRIAVITVEEFSIPQPDITHQLSQDKDQVVVSGKVEEILSPNEFFSRYGV